MKAQSNKVSTSLQLTQVAWRTLMLDKELISIAVLATILQTLLFGVYAYVAVFVMPDVFLTGDQSWMASWQYYAVAALYIVSVTFVANYCNGAISYAALRRFRGENSTVGSAMAASRSKIGILVAYTGLEATVGLVLTILSDRLPMSGKVTTWIAGTTWSIATMFSLPVIMDDRETKPLRVVRASAKTFLNVWAESIFIGVTLGAIAVAISTVTMSVVIALAALGIALSSNVLMAAAAVAFVLWIVLLAIMSLIMAALKQIVMTAAYYYATTKHVPAGFDEELIRKAFRPKKKWLQV